MTLFCRRRVVKFLACRDILRSLHLLLLACLFPFFSPCCCSCIEYFASGLSMHRCVTHDAPPRDELVEWLSTRPNMEVRAPSLSLRACLDACAVCHVSASHLSRLHFGGVRCGRNNLVYVLILAIFSFVARSPSPNTYVSRDSLVKIYTGQGVPPGVAGEGGIRADSGEPRHPEDKILLWNAIRASRVLCKGERRREGRVTGGGDDEFIPRVSWYFLTLLVSVHLP